MKDPCTAGRAWPDPALFKPAAIDGETRAANEAFRRATFGAPDWWRIGVKAYREGAARGKGPFPHPEKSPRARTILTDGKGGHAVALRVIPSDRPAGVYLFMHGGGMVFGSSEVGDAALERIGKSTGMACVSAEYRLAPEHPYPAAWDDCESAASWLVRNAKAELGTLHAIHARFRARGVARGSRYEIERIVVPVPGVALAHVRRVSPGASAPASLVEDVPSAGAFSEMALYVLVRHGDDWWVVAGQNTPIRGPQD